MGINTHVSDVESDRVELGLEVIFKLTGASGVRMSELFRKVEDMRLPLSERERMDRLSA